MALGSSFLTEYYLMCYVYFGTYMENSTCLLKKVSILTLIGGVGVEIIGSDTIKVVLQVVPMRQWWIDTGHPLAVVGLSNNSFS